MSFFIHITTVSQKKNVHLQNVCKEKLGDKSMKKKYDLLPTNFKIFIFY